MNRLAQSKSKYLQQHAANPIHWYPWGEEPFIVAKRENKPVLVSIGYAACHWCHVMAHESFEDEAVAEFMNEHFICIKVDREEHPDVDQFYMDALQSLSGNGGWPLNMFVTPEKKPFYGGTYFPPEPLYGRSSWMDLLRSVAQAWRSQPEDIAHQSEQMMKHLEQVSTDVPVLSQAQEISRELIAGICQSLLVNADKEWGGFGAAPKFPASFSIQFLLDFYSYQERKNEVDKLGETALAQATLTLDKMLAGGIYDQVGGGFFRYATDAEWTVPHYEKMLYDNALMIITLSAAWRITGREHYRRAVKETIDFCNREMKHPDLPGFYCSLDADADGREGAFYTWTATEWQNALPSVHPAVNAYFGMSDAVEGEPEHPLLALVPEEEIIRQFELSGKEWKGLREDARQKLLQFREHRQKPGIDDKILLSWNALMNRALQEAAIALKDERLLKQSEKHLHWLLSTFKATGNEWKHVYKSGEAYIEAKLDDLAFLLNAMIHQAQHTAGETGLTKAKDLLLDIEALYAAKEKRFYYYSSRLQQDVPIRKIDTYDGAQPSANAIMAENLLLLGSCFGVTPWLEQAEKMLAVMGPTVNRYARSFAFWAGTMQRVRIGLKQLVITGHDVAREQREWSENYFPDVFTLINKGEDSALPLLREKSAQAKPRLYLCYQFQCLEPLSKVQEVVARIKKMK
ncbi:MAG TPA: thioredoxin domain-containing protein [Edaphocola sp.]|nr:thioredoxin domain-containing protein [Edaphocola sp.]